MVSSIVAREATVEQSFVRTLIAQHVTIARPSGVLVLIAGRVEGDVRPVIDWRARSPPASGCRGARGRSAALPGRGGRVAAEAGPAAILPRVPRRPAHVSAAPAAGPERRTPGIAQPRMERATT